MSQNATRDDARIGDFTLDAEIGKGSFATVYKGYRIPNREPVAIKVVTRKKLTTKLLENLEGEIAILKAINHPNIVELKECLKTDSHIYLVMAFCSAGDLSQYIKKRYNIPSTSAARLPHPIDGGLNETIVRSILTQLTAALEFMRGRDIVHRDIKPQNLLLQPPDPDFVALGNPADIPQVKVADFGFARHLSNNVLAETLCGSPLYMAPEILRYEKYDAKADLWSVGAVLYEMSVGKPPFKANNHVELLRRIEKGEDRIKFPDERSAGSLAREAARRQEAGEPPLPPPHLVSGDIKTLIRGLLRRKPVERMSFDEFFRNPVIEDYKAQTRANNTTIKVVEEQVAEKAAPKEVIAQASPSRSPHHPRTSSGAAESSRAPAAQCRASTPQRQTSSTPRSFATKYVVGDSLAPVEAPQPKGPSPSRDDQSSDPPAPTRKGSPSKDDEPDNEASILGKEYVMVEKRNVEVNALADELAASPQQRQSTMTRRPSRLARLGSGVASTAGESSPIRISSTPPGGVWPTPAPFALPPGARPSSFPRRTSLSSSGSPSPRLTTQPVPAARDGASISINEAYSVSPASSALARAISMASLRLFGVPSGMSLRGAAALVRSRTSRRAGAESALLTTLEDFGQKSFVLSEFADSKLASDDLDEIAAAESLVLYVKALSFLQRGINATKFYLESSNSASHELNELVQWLRARFNDGYEKADFARSKCGEIPESAQHVDRLIFDKALEVARAAAMDELENNRDNWDPASCLLAYETASSMLQALLDPGEETMGLSDGSIATVEKFVKSIGKRVVALQSRAAV